MHSFSHPFLTFHRFLFSPSTLFPWLFCPCFFFHLCTFVSLILWFCGGRRMLTAPFLTSTLIFSGFQMHFISRAQWSPVNTLLLTHIYFFVVFLSKMIPKSSGRLSCCLLVEHCSRTSKHLTKGYSWWFSLEKHIKCK